MARPYFSGFFLWSGDKFTANYLWSEVMHTPFIMPFILKIKLLRHNPQYSVFPITTLTYMSMAAGWTLSEWSHRGKDPGLWITTWRRATTRTSQEHPFLCVLWGRIDCITSEPLNVSVGMLVNSNQHFPSYCALFPKHHMDQVWCI